MNDYTKIRKNIDQPFVSLSMEIMNRIMYTAKKRGLKSQDVSKLSGISNSYLSQLKSGHKLINVKTISKITEALNVDVSFNIKERKIYHEWDEDKNTCLKCGKDWMIEDNCISLLEAQ